jgi:hypothetical protein
LAVFGVPDDRLEAIPDAAGEIVGPALEVVIQVSR